MRRASRTDRNHAAVREAARRAGCAWADTFRVGQGFPDGVLGLVTHGGRPVTLLIEVKMPGEKLTPDEQAWWADWRGAGEVVYGPEHMLEVVAKYRKDSL